MLTSPAGVIPAALAAHEHAARADAAAVVHPQDGLDALVERPRGPSELDLLASKLLGERFLARAEVRYLRWH